MERISNEISKKDLMKKILITGGSGFIGAHVVKHFVKKYTNFQIFNLDCLTNAAEPKILAEIESFKDTEDEDKRDTIKAQDVLMLNKFSI